MKQNEIYICEGESHDHLCCIMEVISEFGDCAHVPECCGAPMILVEPKTADQGREKHVPVIYPADGGYEVKVVRTYIRCRKSIILSSLNCEHRMQLTANILNRMRIR